MMVTTHQADLLPYSGFWFKMHHADIFDLKIYDQFQARGYQRRVMMRGKWASIPVLGNPTRERICDVRLQVDEGKRTLIDLIVGRYRGSRHWADRGESLLAMVDEIHSDHLWQFNLSLILGVRTMLGITTPIAIGVPPRGRGVEGLVNVLREYGADSYLAGQGGRAYMGDCNQFRSAGIDVVWSAHRPATSDSIVSVLMDFDDPLSVVLQSSDHKERESA